MNRIFRNTIFYLLIFLVIIGVVVSLMAAMNLPIILSYDEFVTHLENGDVKVIFYAA